MFFQLSRLTSATEPSCSPYIPFVRNLTNRGLLGREAPTIMIRECGPPRILIVEDDVFIALDEESLVRSVGCHVAGPVARLDDAWRIIDTDRIDGALLDVNLN